MQNSGRGYEHFAFIMRTERKSLFTQIKTLVSNAQEVANEELQERSQRLKKLLDTEDQVYEEEFANKVKTRIDEDIRERKNALHAIMETNTKQQQRFLEKKRIQQVMESCYEIREKLRAEDLKNVKICQAEQINEKMRRKEHDARIDKYWVDVENKRWEKYDREMADEIFLQEKLNAELRHVLKVQVDELQERRNYEQLEKEEDAKRINDLLESMRLEKFENDNRATSSSKTAYREELLEEIAKRKAARDAEALALKEEHFAFIRETQRLEAEEQKALAARKLDLNTATKEYIAYVRRMRALEAGIGKMMNDRIDDLHHLDVCTKSNISELARKKAEEAAQCNAILQKQICEQTERRLREEAEHHENKMLENRFVHDEVTREQILAKRQQMRRDLEAQIEETKRVRAEEEKRFEMQLQKAIDDPEVCTALAEQYIREGVDYLAPHPNWRIHACPVNKCEPQAAHKAKAAPRVTSAANEVDAGAGDYRLRPTSNHLNNTTGLSGRSGSRQEMGDGKSIKN